MLTRPIRTLEDFRETASLADNSGFAVRCGTRNSAAVWMIRSHLPSMLNNSYSRLMETVASLSIEIAWERGL
jgi:hypothetical protein